MDRHITSVIGCDLGSRRSEVCVLDTDGNVVERRSVPTDRDGFASWFGKRTRARVVIEACTQSAWVSELLAQLGHEVIVANPRKVHLIGRNRSKTDKVDAELLARLGRVDPQLLSPIRHRGRQAREDLVVVRTRAALVSARTALINHVRTMAKANGQVLRSGSSETFARSHSSLSPTLAETLRPAFEMIAQLTEQIRQLDRKVERELPERHPVMKALAKVDGVGPITSATFVLTIDDPSRFSKSRLVGAYLGLCPTRRQSGDKDPELSISRQGDRYLRSILVQCAQRLLGPRGVDCDLRRLGLRLAERGGKTAKRRAVIAVARRLAVLLHRLWSTGAEYEPLHSQQLATA